jgi:hypothetical protein
MFLQTAIATKVLQGNKVKPRTFFGITLFLSALHVQIYKTTDAIWLSGVYTMAKFVLSKFFLKMQNIILFLKSTSLERFWP